MTSSVSPPPRQLRTSSRWQSVYPRILFCLDACCVILALLAANHIRFGAINTQDTVTGSADLLSYRALSVAIFFLWFAALTIWSTRSVRILGVGTNEFSRVLTASFYIFGLIAIISYAFRIEVARGFVAVAFPIGLFLLMVVRATARLVFSKFRKAGRCMRSVVVVGRPSSAIHLARQIMRTPRSGLTPIGFITPGYTSHELSSFNFPLPVLSQSSIPSELMSVLTDIKTEAVAIAGDGGFKPNVLRRLGWLLADQRISTMMSPNLTDIAGPRIHTQVVEGTALLHISTPRLDGIHGFTKRVFDIFGSGVGLFVLSPLFLVTAALIRMDSPGPVFYMQERIGRDGKPFKIYKFRSMCVNAHQLLPDLNDKTDGNGIMFKMHEDPRITKVGKWIRRFSIDELPQLLNVIIGDMSLVGPRPPLPDEVAEYEADTTRRLRVLPGITGLWQVSGRSDLSWEDSVRLDLYYIENWSLVQDLVIIVRTVRAVVSARGAY
ncbi:sugar transferase [Brevibacterium sp. 50QC2O2]|uniref:sugar transferase n=1 Tax=Brevibacterium sp. 50QC2O2 TaxID=2968459 RepID=UPI00211D1533|nr:sugar transferase [Brevibacterium sp. 50QC2O2]MCQ9388082.1 sugar transferase [Brevibacterium sp. 50QC2O2]